MSNIQRRRSGIYECRVTLPKELRGRPAPAHIREEFPDLVNAKTGCFKHEITRSLKTTDPDASKKLGRKESVRLHDMVDRMVARLENASPQASSIVPEEIASDLIAELLAADEEEREGDDRRNMPRARIGLPDVSPLSFDPGELGMEEDHFIAYGELIEEDAKLYREALARRDASVVERDVQRILRRKGLAAPAEATKRRQLNLKVLEAAVEAYELIAQRQAGKVVVAPEPAGDLGPKLSEAYDLWRKGVTAKAAKKPGANTIIEAENVVRRFKELHGDLRLGGITRAHVREFRDALARMPSRLPNKLRKLPLKELLKRDLSSYPPRYATTVNKQLAILSAIISNADSEGLMENTRGFANPVTKRVKLSIDEREIEEREAFDIADLRALFGTPVFAQRQRPKGGAGEAAFWFPLISLFSGMRLAEIAGLC